MFSLLHYVSATRRLEECQKTIIMMGGSEFHDLDIPPQLAAQREMIKREVEYYGESFRNSVYVFFAIATLTGLVLSALTVMKVI